MPHLSYKEFKNKFGDLGITEWVKYNWIGWSSDKVAYYLRLHLSEIAEIDFDDTGVVDLGTLDWEYYGSGATAYLQTQINPLGVRNSYITTLTYTNSPITSTTETDKLMYFYGDVFRIKDSDYTNATTFKTAMSGVLLAYELS